MARIQDLPRLVSEFGTMAKEYMVQETIEPAKKLGRFAGMSLGAALAWLIALVLLSVAGLRGIIALLPEGAYWEALAYLLFALILVGFMAILFGVGPKSSPAEGGEE
jgi:hypothetical protein